MTSPDVTIRAAQESDAEAIWRVHTSCIVRVCSSHYSPVEVDTWAKRQKPENYVQFIKKDYYIVAERRDHRGQEEERRSLSLVGFAHLGKSDASKMLACCEMEVKALYVSPESQRIGVGKALLWELEEQARKVGCTCLGVCSTLNAVTFYEARGFVVIKDQAHCVGTQTLQCKIMQKKL